MFLCWESGHRVPTVGIELSTFTHRTERMGTMLPHPHTSGRVAQLRQEAFLAEAERHRLASQARGTAQGTTSLGSFGAFVLAQIVRLPWTWRRTRLSTPLISGDDNPVQLAPVQEP